METVNIGAVLVVLWLAVTAIYLFQRMRLPGIVGLFLTGVFTGPHGLGLIKAVKDVEAVAELGIILLLFSIGIEFSLSKLLETRRAVLRGGMLQVGLTILVVVVLVAGRGGSWQEAVFAGFLVALSSTAIVMKIIQERAEVDSPHGRNALGILIFQDLIIIPMMLFVPFLASVGMAAPGSMAVSLLGKAAGVLVGVILASKWLMPFLLDQIARLRSRELFLLCIVVFCLSIAWLTSRIGLSFSLGAFLAGLIISESQYSHYALGNIIPLRDVFASFFFISVGMLLDINFVFYNVVQVGLVAVAVLILKAVIAALTALILGLPLRTAVLVGLALGQIGEFSFVLSQAGLHYHLLSAEAHQLFLAVAVLTMAATPFSLALAPRLADGLLRLPVPLRLKTGLARDEKAEEAAKDKEQHLIIAGFGVNGRNLARVAAACDIPYVVVDLNPDAVQEGISQGMPVFYGDAAQEEVLLHARVKEARVIVVAISDPLASFRIVASSRRLNPEAFIVVRTRYVQEIERLYQAGASEVIAEEFEASLEILSLVMRKFLIPRGEIEKLITDIRASGYAMLRVPSGKSATFRDLQLHHYGSEIVALKVEEKAPAAGKTLEEIDLRKKYGITVLLLRRGQEVILNPGAETRLVANDVAVVFGNSGDIVLAAGLFQSAEGHGEGAEK